VGYNVTLENKVLEVNNGTGFIEGGVWCWSTCAIKNGSRPPLVISMDIKRMVFSKIKLKLMHIHQIGLGANAAPGDIRYVDVNGDMLLMQRIELI
jgi:hypothetical protein